MARTLDVSPYGVRRQSQAATALLLIQCHPLTPKRRRASLAAALHIFAMTLLVLQDPPALRAAKARASSCLKVVSRNVAEVIGNNTTKEN